MDARVRTTIPIQAPPVRRDTLADPSHEQAGGVSASKTKCANLRGPAQQACYALHYGART